MNLDSRFFSIAFLFAGLLLGVFVFNKDNIEFEKEFSPDLMKWFQRGKIFKYKSAYDIFYVYQDLNIPIELDNEVNKHFNDQLTETTVLFLHGFPTSSYDYHKLWDLFMTDFALSDRSPSRVDKRLRIDSLLTFDYLGYGFSDKPSDYEYSIFDMADMIERLLMFLDIKSVIIIAHDISDTVAQELLRRDNLNNQNHFKIEKCILLNGGIMTSIYKPILSQHILLNQYFGQIFADYFFRFVFFKRSFRNVFGEFAKPDDAELYDFFLAIRFKQGNHVLPKTIKYMREREQFGDVWYDALNETALPVMFIYGPADPINPRDRFPQKLRLEIPKVKLHILSDLVGHYPAYEDAFTVYSLIQKFLSY